MSELQTEKQHVWRRPRPPLGRLCSLDVRSTGWPEEGAGVWRIEGFHDLGSECERWQLRRMMPYDLTEPVGQTIKILRMHYEEGRVKIFRGGQDLFDPYFSQPPIHGSTVAEIQAKYAGAAAAKSEYINDSEQL